VKTDVWRLPRMDPASVGVTWLDLGTLSNAVLPAKAGIHEFSHKLFSPALAATRLSLVRNAMVREAIRSRVHSFVEHLVKPLRYYRVLTGLHHPHAHHDGVGAVRQSCAG
jgi:hypothetical protein